MEKKIEMDEEKKNQQAYIRKLWTIMQGGIWLHVFLHRKIKKQRTYFC